MTAPLASIPGRKAQAAPGGIVPGLAELIGFGLLVWFGYLVWAPLAVLLGGLLLIGWANLRTPNGKTAASIGAAWGAAWAAWKAQQERR